MAISDNPNTLSGGPDPKFPGPDNRNVRVSANAGSAVKGSLSGPDTPGTAAPPVRGAGNSGGALSGPDTQNEFISPVPNIKRVTGGSSPASPITPAIPGGGNEFISPVPGIRRTTGGYSPPDPHVSPGVHGGGGAYISPIPGERVTAADPYYFFGSISEETLHLYLDKSLQVANLSNEVSYGGPSYPQEPVYYPLLPPYEYYSYPSNPYYRTSDPTCPGGVCDHGLLLQLIVSTGAKYVWDMLGFYQMPDNDTDLEYGLANLFYDIEYIHANDPDVICGGSVTENTGTDITQVKVPVAGYDPESGFYYDPVSYFYPHGRTVSSGDTHPEYFDWKSMVYSEGDCVTFGVGCGADITKPEYQLWLYYMATKLIDAGCEAITFGAFTQVCHADFYLGLKNTWYVYSLIRAYASGSLRPGYGARRGVVLLNYSATVELSDISLGYVGYFDPDVTHPLPTAQRQLIGDFISFGVYPDKSPIGTCYDPLNEAGYEHSSLPVVLNPGRGIINFLPGGRHPQGWICVHSPGLNRLDNDHPWDGAGCSYSADIGDPAWYWCYGYDQSSWYARNLPHTKLDILRYCYYRIKCLDPYNHFAMPGRMWIHKLSNITSEVAIAYNGYEEAGAIADIFSGVDRASDDWVFHNFTNENLVDSGVLPASGLVFVRDYLIFYIGVDGYIHGYIKVNGDFNGGTWVTIGNVVTLDGFTAVGPISLSGASYTPAGGPVKAKSDLVASPDGTKLLYIGIDGYIYGYNIIYGPIAGYPPTYGYIDLSITMSSYVTQAVTSLIITDDDHIFYIGTKHGVDVLVVLFGTEIDGNVVLGFKIDWGSGSISSNDPSVIAESVHGQPYPSQLPAAGALVFDPGTNRLYYRATDGLLAYYQANASLSDFYYYSCPYNSSLVIQHLKVVGNLAIYGNLIYFVCLYTIDGSNFINCIVDDGTPSWSSFSPSFDAVNLPIASQVRSDTSGFIAVSPDGSIIAYFGNNTDKSLFYFEYTGGVCTYNEFPPVAPEYLSGHPVFLGTDNSLTFINDNDLFYVGNLHINHYRYEEPYCENGIFPYYPIRNNLLTLVKHGYETIY